MQGGAAKGGRAPAGALLAIPALPALPAAWPQHRARQRARAPQLASPAWPLPSAQEPGRAANAGVPHGRASCESDLRPACPAAVALFPQELGLPVGADIPMLGFIGRLDYQKGVDLICDNYDWLMSGALGSKPIGWFVVDGWIDGPHLRQLRLAHERRGAARVMESALGLRRPGLQRLPPPHAQTLLLRLSVVATEPPLRSPAPRRTMPPRLGPPAEGVQLVMLGSGREDLENDLRWAGGGSCRGLGSGGSCSRGACSPCGAGRAPAGRPEALGSSMASPRPQPAPTNTPARSLPPPPLLGP